MHYGPPKNPPHSPLHGNPSNQDLEFGPRSPILRWACGIVAILFGGAILFLAAAVFFGGQEDARQGPRVASAAELRLLQDPAVLSSPWISYTAPKVFDPMIYEYVTYKKKSRVKYILLQVEDRWLLTRVRPDFAGNKVGGSLVIWGGATYNDVAKRVHAMSPAHADRLLPYHLDAEYDYGINSRYLTLLAGFLALFGGSVGWAGLKMVRTGRPEPLEPPEPLLVRPLGSSGRSVQRPW